jgi:hypothetical protein
VQAGFRLLLAPRGSAARPTTGDIPVKRVDQTGDFPMQPVILLREFHENR